MRKWNFDSQRVAYAETLIELGEKYPDMVVLDADLSTSTQTARFGKVYPDRFFNMGIQEQNMMGVAAGFATTGRIVFASTFAVFATGRAYDIIRQSICYPNLNVKIVASHAGITVGADGASHQMIEDLGLMTTLPNMKVFVPADAPQTRDVVRGVAEEFSGPAYVRLSREKVPTVTEGHDFNLFRAQVLRDGSDVTVIATGLLVAAALEAAEILKGEVDLRVLNMVPIKPIDREAVIKAARETNGIVTAEEHNIYNGLGSRVAEVLVEEHPVPMRRLGVPDVFGISGKGWELMDHFNLNARGIVEKVKEVIR